MEEELGSYAKVKEEVANCEVTSNERKEADDEKNPLLEQLPRQRDPIAGVCNSSRLEDFFTKSTELELKLPVPRSESADFVSERTTGMALPEEQDLLVRRRRHFFG